MKTLIINYELSKIPHYQKVLFNRELYGYLDNSNKGKYKYNRQGILHKIKNIRLGRGAFVFVYKDRDKVLKLFKKYKIEYDLIPATISEKYFYYC
jgi:hypothetical protein